MLQIIAGPGGSVYWVGIQNAIGKMSALGVIGWLGMVPRLGPLKWDGVAPPAKERMSS